MIFALAFSAPGQDAPPSEYRLKAAYLYNFAKFVEWPTQAFENATSPLIVGVLGENVFGSDLEQTLAGKTINGHPVEVRTFRSATEATKCHLLFISPSLREDSPKIIAALRGTSVLTVGETDQFINSGGMIRFFLEEGKIRFQISDQTAQKAGLKISSKLLSLASPIR